MMQWLQTCMQPDRKLLLLSARTSHGQMLVLTYRHVLLLCDQHLLGRRLSGARRVLTAIPGARRRPDARHRSRCRPRLRQQWPSRRSRWQLHLWRRPARTFPRTLVRSPPARLLSSQPVEYLPHSLCRQLLACYSRANVHSLVRTCLMLD